MAAISRIIPTLGPDHTGLVLFDTLEGYLHPKDPEKKAFLAERNILPNMQRLLAGARAAGLTTFYPSALHAPDGSDTVARLTDTDIELRPLDPKTAFYAPLIHKGSQESRIAAELAPAEGDVVVPKHRWSSFYSTDLEFHLKVRGIDTIILAGGSTDVGIASTAYAARDMDLGLIIVRDCCYSTRGDNNAFFMQRVFPRMGRVMNVAEVIKLMMAGGRAGREARTGT